MAKDDIARPRNSVIFLQSPGTTRSRLLAQSTVSRSLSAPPWRFIATTSLQARRRRFSRPLFNMGLCGGVQLAAAADGQSPACIFHACHGAAHERRRRPRARFCQYGCSARPHQRGAKGGARGLRAVGGCRRNFPEAAKIADPGYGSENWTGGPFFPRPDVITGSDRRVPESLFAQEEMIAVWLRRARRSAAV